MSALPVWPVNVDYSVHTDVVGHVHVCPDCRGVSECPNPWLGEPCQAAEWFTHDPHLCDGRPAATDDQLAELRANLHLVNPAYLPRAREAVPTGSARPAPTS